MHPLPPHIFKYIEHTSGTVLLHSSRPGESRFSRLFTAPLQIIEISRLNDLAQLFSTIQHAIQHGQFAAGYCSYECAQYFEPAAAVRPRLPQKSCRRTTFRGCRSWWPYPGGGGSPTRRRRGHRIEAGRWPQ